MALNIGRKGKAFVKLEASYGASNTSLAAANAVRTTETPQVAHDPYARVTSPERKQSPGAATRFNRPDATTVGSFNALLRPSGTLNTLPECDPILEAAFGAKSNVTLATTVAADPVPTASTFALASVVGLAKHQAISIVVAARIHVRFISVIAGSTVTVEPALPSAPANGAVVKGLITYRLSTDLAKSLHYAEYLPGFTREVLGWGVDRLTLTFPGVEEPAFSASGPAQTQNTPAQSEPGAFTTVGALNPPNGMSSNFLIDDTVYLHKNLELAITNGLALRNVEAGTEGLATEVYRNARRECTANLAAFVETEATLYDKAEAGTDTQLFRQNGFTEGNIVAAYCPRIEFKPAETTTGQEAVDWNFTGQALESADGENDEVIIAFG